MSYSVTATLGSRVVVDTANLPAVLPPPIAGDTVSPGAGSFAVAVPTKVLAAVFSTTVKEWVDVAN